MIFHIGKRKVISLNSIIGVFSSETIESSLFNEYYKEEIDEKTKSLIVDKDDEIIVSEISSNTLIEREIINKNEMLWVRGENVRKL